MQVLSFIHSFIHSFYGTVTSKFLYLILPKNYYFVYINQGNLSQEWRVNYSNSNKLWHFLTAVIWHICYCTIIALFYFVFAGDFQVQAPGGLYSEGWFNRGFFALRVWGTYIWRGFGGAYFRNFTVDSMLPCICSVIDHRWRQNVVKTKKWHTSRRRVCHWCF